MTKQMLKFVLYVLIFVAPTMLLAQPTFSGGLCDTCVSPIDQQTLLLASGGVVYAIRKIRESRRKK